MSTRLCLVGLVALSCGERRDGRCDLDSDCGERQACEAGLCQNRPAREGEGEGEGEGELCNEVQDGLRVYAVDPEGAPVCDAGVTAERSDGEVHELRVVFEADLTPCEYVGVSVAGTYTVRVVHASFEEFQRDGVAVPGGTCGPITQLLRVELLPKPVD